MSGLEDQIRDGLRAEAGRLREVRPLQLPQAGRDRKRGPRSRRARWAQSWRAPLTAAAVIVLVAAGLVTARVLRNDAAGHRPAAPTGAIPRYYLHPSYDPAANGGTFALYVFDRLKPGSSPAPHRFRGGNSLAWAASGAADDRTFVMTATPYQFPGPSAVPPAQWYLVKLDPGGADPVRVTRLALQATPATANASLVKSIALSADGTELAVVSGTGHSATVGVYSVATGRRQYSWNAAVNVAAIAELTWVGDSSVGFAYTDASRARQQVRTLSVRTAGTGLLAGSRIRWSQPVPRGGSYQPGACNTPLLTGNGQAVVCATSSSSAGGSRLSAVWLLYPLAAPSRPRVIGRVTEPPGTSFPSRPAVQWTNADGSGVIGYFQTAVSGEQNDFFAVLAAGRVTLSTAADTDSW